MVAARGPMRFMIKETAWRRQVALRSSRVAEGRHERHPLNPPLPRFPLSSRDHRLRRVALSPISR